MPKQLLLARNEDTGAYDLVRDDRGSPASTATEVDAVLTQLLETRGSPGFPGWIYDETGDHGSLLYLVQNDNPDERSRVVAYALDALKALVDENRITGPTCAVSATTPPGRLDAVVTWTTPDGTTQDTRLPIGIG